MGKLTGKRVVVTGGGQGLGLAIVQGLIAEGCELAIHYHNSREGAEQLVAEATKANLKAQAFQADLTDEQATKTFVHPPQTSLAESTFSSTTQETWSPVTKSNQSNWSSGRR